MLRLEENEVARNDSGLTRSASGPRLHACPAKAPGVGLLGPATSAPALASPNAPRGPAEMASGHRVAPRHLRYVIAAAAQNPIACRRRARGNDRQLPVVLPDLRGSDGPTRLVPRIENPSSLVTWRRAQFEDAMAQRLILALPVVLAWATSHAEAQMGMQETTGREERRPTIEQRFQRLDTDNDGFIAWEEAEPRRGAEFRALDRDGNGVVTADEWLGRTLPLQEFDADHDGVITQAEYLRKHRAMFESFDADRDGRISRPEFAKAQQAGQGQ